ncbi:PREDICTED: uncharacterized protein At4g04775-like [Camelina sativa]|uniref:Uncharacterized protein At4g04775-like n=1 Tax=Camelina sativa TaxID=90675 RepID=A0ABM0WPC7_CAMSA|nr:PREDICTED: uncharacterized protein At4g04775-like [Camelina sativa]
MSNVSGASSGSSNVRQSGFVVGVPKTCWCGEQIVAKNTKSEPNSCWRYFRCREAAGEKLANDNHTFKWVDEAQLDEVTTLGVQMDILKEEMKELSIEALQDQKMKFEKMQMEFKKELLERV